MEQELVDHYEWGVGIDPGHAEVRAFAPVTGSGTALSAHYDLPNEILLANGVRYYSSVRAYDIYGLFVEYTSNGVTVDTTPPTPGVVYDGEHFKDRDAQASSTTVSASWLGFADYESGVVRYEMAVATSPATATITAIVGSLQYQHKVPLDPSARFASVGLQVSAMMPTTMWPGLTLLSGRTYYIFVRAINGAGLVGDAVPTDDGFVWDSTPPVATACVAGSVNVVIDGSFEVDPTLSPWVQTQGVGGPVFANNSKLLDTPDRSASFYHLSAPVGVGSVAQNISTVSGQWYRISFAAAGYPRGQIQGQAGRVQAADLDRVFTLTDGHIDGYWRLFHYEFHAISNSTLLVLSAIGNGLNRGLGLDAVQVVRCASTGAQVALPSVVLPSGREFAAIDSRSPDQAGLACQAVAAAVPPGWTLAPDDNTVRQVVAEHSWGAGCVVLASGQAYYSRTRGTSAGTLCGGCPVSGCLLTQSGNGVSGGLYGTVCTGASRVVLVERVSLVHMGKPFQNSQSHVQAWWSMDDAESGLQEYLWAVGTKPGGTQLMAFTSTGTLPSGDAYGLLLHHNMRVYVTVVARNRVGLVSTISSTPLVIDHTPPVVSAVLDLDGLIDGVDAAVTEAAVLRASWDFNDAESGLQWCDVGFGHQPGLVDVAAFRPVVTAGEAGLAVAITGLPLVHGETYFATVKCANMADLGLSPGVFRFVS